MINAKEAQKLTREGRKEYITQCCEPKIMEAAKIGDNSVQVFCSLDAPDKEIFEELGYKVKECEDRGGWIEISW